MHQSFIRGFCLLAWVSFIFSNAHAMEEDLNVSLKCIYTLKNPIPEEKQWTNSQGIDWEHKKNVTIDFEEINYDKLKNILDSSCGSAGYNNYHDRCYGKYKNYFAISPPEKSLTYVRSLIFATNHDYGHKYYAGVQYKTCDKEITKDVEENLWSIHGNHYNEKPEFREKLPVLYVQTTSQYDMGPFLHVLVSLQLIPRSAITDLLTKAKMSIQIDDFDLSKKLLSTRLYNKCEHVPKNSCHSYYSTSRSAEYDQCYVKTAIEELEKIRNPRQRALLTWELRKKEPDSTNYEAYLKYYDLINDKSLPYYREAKREQALIKFQSKPKDEEHLFPILRTFLDEGADDREAAQVASHYLDIHSAVTSLSLSTKSITKLLSMLKTEKSKATTKRAQEKANSLVSDVKEGKDTEEYEARFQKVLQENLDCETKIKLCHELKKSILPFSEQIERTRIRAQLDFDLLSGPPSAHFYTTTEPNPYLNAIKEFLEIEALPEANNMVHVFLALYCPGEELKNELSVSIDTIFDLLKLIRKAKQENIQLSTLDYI